MKLDMVEVLSRIQSGDLSPECCVEKPVEYTIDDHCADAHSMSENTMIRNIDLDRRGIIFREPVLFNDIEQDIRNRYTGLRLLVRLERLDEYRRRYQND